MRRAFLASLFLIFFSWGAAAQAPGQEAVSGESGPAPAAASAAASAPAAAAPRPTPTPTPAPVAPPQTVLIGQTAGFTGTVASGVKETTEGAKLYFDAVNARGGVQGSKLELISLDDKFDPALAVSNARTLITEKNVVALFLTRGTPHTQAILPLLEEFKVPLVGPSTGAMVLHEPVNKWLFNVRAPYQREAERAVRHLSLVGTDRIAVLQTDDTFGEDAVVGAMRGFVAVNRKPLFIEKFDRSKPDFAQIVPRILKEDAQAVLFLGSGNAVADGTLAIREAGSTAQIVTLSNNASAGFIKSLGPNARGTVVGQVFPYERSMSVPMVKEASELGRARGMTNLTPAMLEGFAAAKVLVEGLRRAGPRPTRERLRNGLEAITGFDLGGLEITYGPNDHTGLDFADLSIVDTSGNFRR